MVQSYRDLVAWNKAMELVTEIYRVTHNFPKEGLFGLMSNFDGQQYRSQATLPKVRADYPKANSGNSWEMPEDPWPRWKLRF
jgi:hypothetical protein